MSTTRTASAPAPSHAKRGWWGSALRIGAALCACAALAACETIEMARDGLFADKSGHRSDREGGIGGTGIFGSVTELGSLHVNGLRVLLPEGLVVDGPLGARPAGTIMRGETVAIVASNINAGLSAEAVSAFNPLVGPITALGDGFAVMGTPVAVDPGAPVLDAAGGGLSLSDLRIGQRVAISGVWRGDRVAATRVALRPQGPDVLAGLTYQFDATGRMAIGVTRIGSAGVRQNKYGELTGRYEDGLFFVDAADYRPLGVFDRPIGTLVVEGYLAPDSDGEGFHLSGFGLPLDPDSPAETLPESRAVFRGSLDGAYLIEAGQALPNSTEARRRLLAPEAAAD